MGTDAHPSERRSWRPAVYSFMYALLTPVAQEHGYALALHGSMTRDMDLIAVPWTDAASDPLVLVEALAAQSGGLLQQSDSAPHGRLRWTVSLEAGAYLDISVMPRIRTAARVALVAVGPAKGEVMP